MAHNFIGLPVSVELSNGTVVEGTVKTIGSVVGTLELSEAFVRRFDGSAAPIKGGQFLVAKDFVKDLTLLDVRPTDHHRRHNSIEAAAVTCLTMPSAMTGSSSTMSPSTYIPMSTSTPEPEISPTKAPRKRYRRKKGARTSQSQGPSGTIGNSSADESPPQAAALPTPGKFDPNQDFDFESGLRAFDKAKVWAEIASADSTDPTTRLVAYNRAPRGTDPMSKIAPSEMVLTSTEQLANGIAVSSLSSPPSPPLCASSHGVSVRPVTLAQIQKAMEWASVERTGPNLRQRVENAGRAIAGYAIEVAREVVREGPGARRIAVLASTGMKGSYSVRAATHLANRGYEVTVLVVGAKPTAAFEFLLRLLLAAGGQVVTQLDGLPPEPHVIIEALAENGTQQSIQATLALTQLQQARIEYTRIRPTISIDCPTNLDYDSGASLIGDIAVPATTHIVCLGALPLGLLSWPKRPANVCLADLSLPSSCWRHAGVKEWAAPWGDSWQTTVKLGSMAHQGK